MILRNRETLIAIFLLLGCGVFIWASFDIRDPQFGTLAPATWPRLVLFVLTAFGLIYLWQSVRKPVDGPPDGAARGGLAGWLRHYRNPLMCYAIYLAFLITLPWLGALVGGVLLVFLLLSVLGGFTPGKLALHAVIAVLSVGAMWALFTFGLRVILPQSSLFSFA